MRPFQPTEKAEIKIDVRGGRGVANEYHYVAGWSSPVAREAHNLEVVSSNLAPATRVERLSSIACLLKRKGWCCYDPSLFSFSRPIPRR
jgi:hypothetical protein